MTDNLSLDPEQIDSAKTLSFRRNYMWTLSGSVAYALCQWVVIVLLSKLGSRETVGRFAFALAVTGPVFMFSQLQLSSRQ